MAQPRIIGLHGAPRINRALYEGARRVECFGERIVVHVKGRGGRRQRREIIRPYGTIVYSLAPGRLLGLLSDVSQKTWTLDARTAAGGEFGDPITLTVRTTGGLALTGPRRRLDLATGEQSIPVTVEWRSTRTYSPEALGLTDIVVNS